MPPPRIDLPSGRWVGHYVQLWMRQPQQMTLEFADGLVRGDGVDRIGAFAIEGEYRTDRGEVRMGWIKTYEGAHSVLYLGKLESGHIVGRWKLETLGSGAFDLSPAISAEGDGKRARTS
jgi:hypothetical protein